MVQNKNTFVNGDVDWRPRLGEYVCRGLCGGNATEGQGGQFEEGMNVLKL